MRPAALASTLALPLGIAACGEMPAAPQASAPAALMAQAGDAPAAVSLPPVRVASLSAAVSDAQERLLPAVSPMAGEPSSPSALRDALALLDDRLAAQDAEGIAAAVAAARQALDALPADQAEALLPEIDAMRLALDDALLSANELSAGSVEH